MDNVKEVHGPTVITFKKVALRQLQEAGAYDDLGENSNQAH